MAAFGSTRRSLLTSSFVLLALSSTKGARAFQTTTFNSPKVSNPCFRRGMHRDLCGKLRNEERITAKSTTLKLSGVGMAVPAAAVASGGVMGAINTFYVTFPILSAMLTCGIKGSVADMLAQRRDKEEFSARRNSAYICYSVLCLGLLSEVLYNRVFPILFGNGKDVFTVLSKVVFDGFIGAPLYWLPPAYFIKAVFFGETVKSGLDKYWHDVCHKGLLRKYWQVWTPVQILTFSVVPDHFRVAFVASVSFVWMMILSCLSGKA